MWAGMSERGKSPKAAVAVAAGLRRRIVLGDLPEGAALPNETELMSQYEVSRPTLREALRILETESLISVKRGAGGGARVVHPEPSVAARHAATALRIQGTTLADVFTARSIIEPAAVDLLVGPGARRAGGRRAAAPPPRGIDGGTPRPPGLRIGRGAVPRAGDRARRQQDAGA